MATGRLYQCIRRSRELALKRSFECIETGRLVLLGLDGVEGQFLDVKSIAIAINFYSPLKSPHQSTNHSKQEKEKEAAVKRNPPPHPPRLDYNSPWVVSVVIFVRASMPRAWVPVLPFTLVRKKERLSYLLHIDYLSLILIRLLSVCLCWEWHMGFVCIAIAILLTLFACILTTCTINVIHSCRIGILDSRNSRIGRQCRTW